MLDRLGIRTLGDFAALPFADVLARFGSVGAWAHRLASGGDLAPPVLRRTEQDIAVRYDFEDPPTNVEQAAFVARHVAGLLDSALRDAGRALPQGVDRGRDGARRGARAHVAHRRRPPRGRVRPPHGRPRPLAARGLAQRDHARPRGVRAHRHHPDRAGRDRGRRGAGVPLGRRLRRRRPGAPGDGAHPGPRGGGGGARRDGAGRAHPARPRLARPVRPGGPRRAPRRPPLARPASRPRARHRPRGPRARPRPRRRGQGRRRHRAAVRERGPHVGGDAGRGRRRCGDGRRADDGRPVPVDAWAGPWPVVERWWSEDASRRAYLQVALRDGRAVLVASRQGQWTLEAVYD